MWWVLVLGVVAACAWVLLVRARATPGAARRTSQPPVQPPVRSPSDVNQIAERISQEIEARMPELMRQIEADAAALMPEIEAEAARHYAEMVRESAREIVAEPPDFPKPDNKPVRLGPNGGPTWMEPGEWAEKVAAYRAQGRTPEGIREVAEYLQRNGPKWPPTLAERKVRAERLGIVLREEYMTPEHEALALAPGQNGFPDARLKLVRDRLLVVTPDGWVNPKSRTVASRAGIWSFAVRGTEHHASAARTGDFTPGALLSLVREPGNAHDPNAVAVYAAGAREPSGYVPRGYAKRLAELLDAGEDMVAVSTRGGGPGHDAVTPHVLVVEGALWDHLNRG